MSLTDEINLGGTGRLISLFFMSGDRFVLEVMISNFTGNATGGFIWHGYSFLSILSVYLNSITEFLTKN